MNPRWLFLCTATLLLFLFANGVDAVGGTYRRTKDGETLIWDNYPASGERAEWSGKRDKDGYATGYGTLTWYKPKRSLFTIAERHEVVVAARYSGKMVRGKFEGIVVRVDPSEKTTHATFVSGDRTGDWTAGPAPDSKRTGAARDQPPSPGSGVTGPPVQSSGVTGQRDETPSLAAVAKAPTEALSPVPSVPARQNTSPPAKESAAPDTNPLQSIVAPPSSLRLPADASPRESIPPTTSSSSTAVPRLETPDVIQLADAEARVNGFDLRKYENPRAEYVAASDTWSVSYDQKSGDGAREGAKHFTVSVDDKTKKTSVVAGK